MKKIRRVLKLTRAEADWIAAKAKLNGRSSATVIVGLVQQRMDAEARATERRQERERREAESAAFWERQNNLPPEPAVAKAAAELAEAPTIREWIAKHVTQVGSA